MVLNRWEFARRWALRHLVVSGAIAVVAAGLVFQLWYPMPYRAMLGVASIFMVLLAVDVVCGPLITFVLASPHKSRREVVVDMTLVGCIQVAALFYGMHAVWSARPSVLAFENDRLTVLSANEIEPDELVQAPQGLRSLPFSGVLEVATRKPKDGAEFLSSLDMSLGGLSPAMRPGWWQTMETHTEQMRAKAKPLAELIQRRPIDAAELQSAADKSGYPVSALNYMPLTSSKTKNWIALLNPAMKMVGHAPVDGF